ncbi:uncharacterized protein LOC123246296 [Gracilinanus agilis]|uniref:uncharacterized protein LOC123246296 n=1 Tax=Gracilinanus agilis TaxID=191870 RepID=UPI001CFD88E4|nr:uncharacterized protein LOC123246296 [Gracilinanus agilis]
MKGSSSQEPNLQLPVPNLKTHGLKEEPSNSTEETISAQIVSHLEMSLFVPMQAIIGKVTSRGSMRVPTSPKCASFPVNLGCSSGPQSDTEKGSGDTLQTTASFLDNTIKGKESENIKEEKKTLKKSVILNVAPVTGMESKKNIETCATQTEETSILLVSHKAVQIPEEPGSELQSSDPSPSFSNMRFVGQKGKPNRKERKCKGRGNVSNSEEEDQAEKNKIKRIDKKQKLETVKVLRRRSIWFQKMTLGDLHPLYTPRPCRIYLLTLEGTHTETATIINGDRQYGLDPEEREEVTLEEGLMTQLVQKGKKTIQETLPKVKVRRSLKQQVKRWLFHGPHGCIRLVPDKSLHLAWTVNLARVQPRGLRGGRGCVRLLQRVPPHPPELPCGALGLGGAERGRPGEQERGWDWRGASVGLSWGFRGRSFCRDVWCVWRAIQTIVC